MCDQLDHSMGSYMSYFQILCILLSAVLIYLLTKIIIEKNETAISMTKILGYENREIASIYLLSTTIVVIVADAICVVLGARDECRLESDHVQLQRMVFFCHSSGGLCENVRVCSDRLSDRDGV